MLWLLDRMAAVFSVRRTLLREKYARESHMLANLGNGYIIDGSITPATVIETNVVILCTKYTHNFEFLAVGFFDGIIRLFTMKDAQYAAELVDIQLRVNFAPVTSIKFGSSSFNTIMASYGNGLIKCWNYETRICLYTISERRQTLGMAFHPSFAKFATVGDDTLINIYNEETHELEQVLGSSRTPGRLSGHSSRVFCVRFHPLKEYEFLTGSWDNTVHLWDLRQQSSVRHFYGVHMCGDAIDISKSGNEILTCAWQDKDPLQIWDYGTGQLITALQPDVFNSKLYCGGYIHKDFLACGGITQNLFRVVDLRTNSTYGTLRGMPHGVYSMDVGPTRPKRNSQPQLPKIAVGCGSTIFEIDYH